MPKRAAGAKEVAIESHPSNHPYYQVASASPNSQKSLDHFTDRNSKYINKGECTMMLAKRTLKDSLELSPPGSDPVAQATRLGAFSGAISHS